MVVNCYHIGQTERSFSNGHHCSFGWYIEMDGYIDHFLMVTTARLDGILMNRLSYFYIRREGMSGGGSLSGWTDTVVVL